MTTEAWIVVELVRPSTGRHKSKLIRYPRSEKIDTREEAEALQPTYAPEHGGQIAIIRVSEFYAKKRRKTGAQNEPH
ncbi:MAG TPA: hypothetical protein VFB23_04140 [Candidatus Acidoferrales bacterium]|jgi:hypothetical protein|nr:hypothetical protein [Candidatus Acidoferrales bacterium]